MMIRRVVPPYAYCLTIFFVIGSRAEVRTRGFQSLPCDVFKRERLEEQMLNLTSLASTVSVNSILSCVNDLLLSNVSTQATQWALVSRDTDADFFRCSFLKDTSSPSEAEVGGQEIANGVDHPFCHVFFTQGDTCENSLRHGWTNTYVMVWARDLDTWLNCNNVQDRGGWTVFQRRQDGSVDFSRGWHDYKYGFGSLSGEFWLGLEYLQRLLIWKKYQLRIDMRRNNGEEYFAVYDAFDIADENEYYRLTVGSYSGNAGDSFSAHNGRYFATFDRRTSEKTNECMDKYRVGFWMAECHRTNPNGIYGSTDNGYGINWRKITGLYESLAFFEMKIRPSGF